MAYITYILKSVKDGKYYIGCTGDFTRRLAQHNSGKVRSTKHRIPFEVVKTEKYLTLSEARRRENYIKSLKGGNQFKRIYTHD